VGEKLMLGVERMYAPRKPRLACTHGSLIKYVKPNSSPAPEDSKSPMSRCAFIPRCECAHWPWLARDQHMETLPKGVKQGVRGPREIAGVNLANVALPASTCGSGCWAISHGVELTPMSWASTRRITLADVLT
jgi:hypothetical protein